VLIYLLMTDSHTRIFRPWERLRDQVDTVLMDSLERRLRHSAHRAGFTYWQACRSRVAGTPGRQDIDPLEFPGLLPWVNLVEVHHRPEGPEFRHRLVGTEIVTMRNRDGTGRWFHDLYEPAKLKRVQRALSEIVKSGTPTLLQETLADVGKPHRTLSSLVLPLASNRRHVDMLMGISQYE